MQISSRFTIALHMLSCMEVFKEKEKITSDFLASSICVNPVIIRKLLSQLREAGIIEVKRGTGGASIAKPLGEITFLDVYRAVDCVEEDALFHFHEKPNRNCPVGRNIHHVLDQRLSEVQKVMEEKLREMTLEDLEKDMDMWIEKEEV